jgi:putative transposase
VSHEGRATAFPMRRGRSNDSARVCLILWSRLCNWKEALVIVKPETLIGSHRKGFKLFCKWKSQAGRPRIPENIRKLIVQMAQENPTWGQARVAAELSVKLGIYVSPRTVRAYWPPAERRGHGRTSSQNWKTFAAIMPSPSSLAISWSWWPPGSELSMCSC